MNLEADPDNMAAIDMQHKRLFNAMNYVLVNSQNVSYHRFIMRALSKAKDNHALQAISGNNSLITGTYRHAMGEYLRVWVNNKRNPLICLLLALTFTHMSCKKDLSSRHLISIRGIAFMKKYSKVRTCQQEVLYNIARMFHQMSILPLAIHFYEKVLDVNPPNIYAFDEDGNEIIVEATK
uniref:TPR_REGION domain-containing protein n=1 Tax=Caenorhabditis japonica TaxID=281687 RepID=A0A8R1DV08_CAEJA